MLDTGQAPVDSIATKSQFSDAFLDELTLEDASTTGRGMFIVSVLASSWGIDELSDGTRVWAEFTQQDESYDAQAPEVTHCGEPSTSQEVDPGDWTVVRFLDCPAALLLAHDDNLADIVRELQLIGAYAEDPSFQRIADLMAGHVQRHAVNWDAARLMAHEAVRAEQQFTDINVLAPKNVIEDVRFLRQLLMETEALSRAGKLMTLPAAPPVQALRDWLEREFIAQAEHGREAVSYRTWLAEQSR